MLVPLMLVLIFGLVAITAVAFFALACGLVIGGIVGAVFGINRKPRTAQLPVMSTVSFCARPNCHAPNPTHARFCHRCGNALAVGRGTSQPARMRYVA